MRSTTKFAEVLRIAAEVGDTRCEFSETDDSSRSLLARKLGITQRADPMTHDLGIAPAMLALEPLHDPLCTGVQPDMHDRLHVYNRTDNEQWSDAEIVRGYRAQHHVETGFRCMKDPHHICLRPQHHWTDQKIEVHVFCCVLALMLCSLLRRDLQRQDIDLSIAVLLEQLGKIREVGILYPAKDKRRSPTLKTTLSQMSEQQQALYDALDLSRYRAP